MTTLMRRTLLLLLCLAFNAATKADDETAADLPKLTTVHVVSSLDGVDQPVTYWVPDSAARQPVAMMVFLHSWSSDYTQDNGKWLKQAVQRDWIFLHPNFRGINNSPQACGSKFARQDVLDSIDFACEEFNVDRSRIYLAGTSGGGHMAMLMAARHPERFSAVSAWVGISDLGSWHDFHVKDGEPQKYAAMILKCLGGPPGTSPEIDADYRDRSPVYHLKNVGDLPIDINAGVRDGKTGSVPIDHSLNAYNAIAVSHGSPGVGTIEIQMLMQNDRLSRPLPSDTAGDATYTREVLLRRVSNNARVTIFDGGHESLPGAACDWLEKQRRLVSAETGRRE